MICAFLNHNFPIFPTDVLNHINSFISDKDEKKFASHVSELLNKRSVNNLKLLYDLKIKVIDETNLKTLNQFLLEAVIKSYIIVTKMLLAIGADVNILGEVKLSSLGEYHYPTGRQTLAQLNCESRGYKRQYNALHIAIENGELEMIRLLITHLVNIDQSTSLSEYRKSSYYSESFPETIIPLIQSLHKNEEISLLPRSATYFAA